MADERRKVAADMANTMNRPVLGRVAAPPNHTADIQMPVMRSETPMLRTGHEIAGEFDGRRLPDAFQELPRHEPRAAGTK